MNIAKRLMEVITFRGFLLNVTNIVQIYNAITEKATDSTYFGD